MKILLLFLSFFLSPIFISAIKFTLPALPPGYNGNRRCLGTHIAADTLVTGYVNSTRLNAYDPIFKTIAYVDDVIGNKHWSKNDITSEVRFSFRTNKALDYQICVYNELPAGTVFKQTPSSDIDLSLDKSNDFFDDTLAHDIKVEPLKREIANLETVMRHIVQEQEQLQKTEMSLRDMNESTNDRVKYLSIFAIVALLALGAWQLLYLKRYFKTKKLI